MTVVSNYNPKISIIVPVYNVENYLEKCINSILNQTYKNFELILVDDGSTDNSLNILNKYKENDKRIKVFHKKNGGQGSARNVALDYATGDYIGFVDSDDYIKENMYEILLKYSIEHNADIVTCGIINDHLFIKKEYKYYEGIKIFSNIEEILSAYYESNYLGNIVWNKLYKSNLWKNIRFPEIRSREDIAILYKIYFSCNKIVRIGDCLYTQFIRPSSTEQRAFTKDKLISIKIIKNQKEYVENLFPMFSDKVSDIVLKMYITCLREIASSGYLKNKELFNAILNEYYIELDKYKGINQDYYKSYFKHICIFLVDIKVNNAKKIFINLIKKFLIKHNKTV